MRLVSPFNHIATSTDLLKLTPCFDQHERLSHREKEEEVQIPLEVTLL